MVVIIFAWCLGMTLSSLRVVMKAEMLSGGVSFRARPHSSWQRCTISVRILSTSTCWDTFAARAGARAFLGSTAPSAASALTFVEPPQRAHVPSALWIEPCLFYLLYTWLNCLRGFILICFDLMI